MNILATLMLIPIPVLAVFLLISACNCNDGDWTKVETRELKAKVVKKAHGPMGLGYVSCQHLCGGPTDHTMICHIDLSADAEKRALTAPDDKVVGSVTCKYRPSPR